MKEYIEKAALYKEIAEMEEMARNWYLDTPWDSPERTRYQSCMLERQRFKHMIADFPTASIEDILGIDYDLNRLRELVEADRDGRCVVLSEPMKPMVYKPNDTDVYCPKCGQTLSGGWPLSDADDYRKLCQCPKCGQSIDDTICEAAEAALKKEETP